MKGILFSVQPQHTVNILNGDKTIEVRKTMPQIKLPCKGYIYCTKHNKRCLQVKKCEEGK